MKYTQCLVLLAATGFASNAAASVVTPSITGTVTQVIPSGSAKRVTLNGHVYTVDANTKSDNATGQLQAGQTVTMLVSPDGTTVMMVHAANSAATHP
jgi:hypothetical protein